MSLSSKFIDECIIEVSSGAGGAGAVSFRREKFVEFGGPDGGNGGHGGDVVLLADPQLSTLLDYRYQPRHIAGSGRPGSGRQCSGRDGADVVLPVPLGTMVYDADTDLQLSDLSKAGLRYIACAGGRGGKGNAHFRSSTRQAPRFAQPGEEAETRSLRLELKLLADVGLVGFPNVGKSSLIARVSAARPKIADYPFTTLEPKLGVVAFGLHQHFVMADIPGLIPGAAAGAGLGSRFLRHLERVSLVVHIVTVEPEHDDRDVLADFGRIEAELSQHACELARLPRILVLNRIDLDFVASQVERLERFAAEKGLAFFPISAATGQGVEALRLHLGQRISSPSLEAGGT